MPPNVNIFEMESCLESLMPFLDKHAKKPYVKELGPQTRKALTHLNESLLNTDEVYTRWRVERGGGLLALKTLQRACKRIQGQLKEAGAIDGYPTEPINYILDKPEALEIAGKLRGFLKEHRTSLDFADSAIETLDKLLSGANNDQRESEKALKKYVKISGSRKLAMEVAIEAIDNIRCRVRDDLGREHPDYLAVKWPAMVAPDPM